ncbi:alpha/beta hydrolase [Rubripirellula amarantea]|nr:alpha/beta hydrolase [Rubripirellula amarantea]
MSTLSFRCVTCLRSVVLLSACHALILNPLTADEPHRASGKSNATEGTNDGLPNANQTNFGSELSENGIAPIYRSPTYKVKVTKGEPYAQGMIYHPTDPSRSYPRNLTLDIYEPQDDLNQKRPVVVLIHGGGFWSMVNGAQYFAQRGWVCFSINYRLQGDRGIAPDGWPANKPTYSATRDAKAAIRWIRANAQQYRIHPDYLVAYGGSAGAYISVALGSSDEEDYRDELMNNDRERPLLENSHRDQSSRAQVVISHWGSGLLLDLLNRYDGRSRFDAEDAPLLMIHGTDDVRVPYSNALDIQKRYQAKVELYTLEGLGHSAWGAKHDGTAIVHKAHNFMLRELNVQPADASSVKRKSN